LNANHLKILENRLLELVILLEWVGVIETEDVFAFVLVGEVAVQDGGLEVTDVEVS
jgi:hypothetical protein